MAVNYLFKNIWSKISNIGVHDTESIEGKLTTYLNQCAILTSIGALVLAIICNQLYSDQKYFIITVALFFLFLLIPVLHYFKKTFWAKTYIVFIVSNWTYFMVFVSGGYFGQGLSSLTTIILGYFFFQDNRKLQVLAIIYNASMFAFTSIYAAFNPQIIPFYDVPLDEIIVYLLCMSWIFVIFPIFDMEKERLINSLQKKNDDLENTTAELERFTHIASHDLKSPLRTIISFLGLMERDLKRKNYENLSQNLEFAKSGAKQLNYLVKDVLELSKINGPCDSIINDVTLTNVVEKVKFNLESELKEKKVKINMTELPVLKANETELILLFQNLIHNGIKYNESKKPSMDIWSEKSNGYYNIYFSDNGIGIEEQYYNKIFEHFKRLHTTEKYSGTGLGLSLCKKIMDKYEGEISVNSKIGEGSTFKISFPNVNPDKM